MLVRCACESRSGVRARVGPVDDRESVWWASKSRSGGRAIVGPMSERPVSQRPVIGR